jgi:DNA uptake protein ComE-like DNA-binding protein
MSITPKEPSSSRHSRGSVLIIVLWIAFGLVSLALYFGQEMSISLKAADNRVAALEAEQAIEGAARYVTYLLSNLETNGMLPDPQIYQPEALPVGDATFWLIGREDQPTATDRPFFALVDESSKLNLNTATKEMLELLPRMTPRLAAAILDWRDADTEVSEEGAEDETYLRLNPAYRAKNANFESIQELRLVSGMELEILFGEDTNLNGLLDANENDGDLTPPTDDRDGQIDPGVLEYVTVFSRQPNTRSDGSARINIAQGGQQQLSALLREKFNAQRASQILAGLGGGGFTSVLDFFIRSRMTVDEFGQIANDITTASGSYVDGLVNVNTASEAVLTCIPGIGPEKAPALVAFRQSNPDKLASIAWITEVLETANALEAGRYLTASTYQCAADLAAVGRFGRGYRRTRFVFDFSETTPKILYRQDLTSLGWALGSNARESLLLLARDVR